MHSQLFRQPRHNEQTGVSSSPLNSTKVGDVDLCLTSKIFLTQATTLSEFQHVCTDCRAPVHRKTERDNDYSHQGL